MRPWVTKVIGIRGETDNYKVLCQYTHNVLTRHYFPSTSLAIACTYIPCRSACKEETDVHNLASTHAASGNDLDMHDDITACMMTSLHMHGSCERTMKNGEQSSLVL